MNREGKLYPIGFGPLLVLAMLVNVLSQTLHETGRHLAYQRMGRDPVWGFTKMAVWTGVTGARTSIIPIKLCPIVKTVVAILFIWASVLSSRPYAKERARTG